MLEPCHSQKGRAPTPLGPPSYAFKRISLFPYQPTPPPHSVREGRISLPPSLVGGAGNLEAHKGWRVLGSPVEEEGRIPCSGASGLRNSLGGAPGSFSSARRQDGSTRLVLIFILKIEYKTRPDKHGRVFLVPCNKWTFSVCYCTVAYT